MNVLLTCLVVVIAALGAASLAFGTIAHADVLDDIKKRGKLVVGVKADYKPWGFRDESGEIVGMEVDLAQNVADTMGVELELVAVQVEWMIGRVQVVDDELDHLALVDNEGVDLTVHRRVVVIVAQG